MYFSDYTSHSAPLLACSGILQINIGTLSVQELLSFVIGAFVELFTVMIWLSFFGLRCTARKKLEIYNL